MRKTLAFILVAAILATALAGCSKNEEKEKFYTDLDRFQNLVERNNGEIYAACVNERKYMDENNILTANEDNRAEIALYAFYQNENLDLDAISGRMEEIKALYEEIAANQWANKKAKDAVDLAGTTWASIYSMFGLMLQPEGSQAEFKDNYNKLTDLIDEEVDHIRAFLDKK